MTNSITPRMALRDEVQHLAHTLVHIDRWTEEAARQRQFQRAGELEEMRWLVIARRSELMRELWTKRS